MANAPSHWIRPPKLTPIWLPRPESRIRFTWPLVVGDPSGLVTRPASRDMRTSCMLKLTSSSSWLNPSVIGFAAGRRAGEVGATASTARPTAAAERAAKATTAAATRDRADVVVAGHQAPDAELSLVVGLPSAGAREPPVALKVLITHHADGD